MYNRGDLIYNVSQTFLLKVPKDISVSDVVDFDIISTWAKENKIRRFVKSNTTFLLLENVDPSKIDEWFFVYVDRTIYVISIGQLYKFEKHYL